MRTLVVTYDKEGGIDPVSINLYWAEHEGDSFEKSLREAFTTYAGTAEGKEFIKANGENWGDALEIPARFLSQ